MTDRLTSRSELEEQEALVAEGVGTAGVVSELLQQLEQRALA
jgi:hypothetical protein